MRVRRAALALVIVAGLGAFASAQENPFFTSARRRQIKQLIRIFPIDYPPQFENDDRRPAGQYLGDCTFDGTGLSLGDGSGTIENIVIR